MSFFANTFISSTIDVFQFGSPKASFQACLTKVENKEHLKALNEEDKIVIKNKITYRILNTILKEDHQHQTMNKKLRNGDRRYTKRRRL